MPRRDVHPLLYNKRKTPKYTDLTVYAVVAWDSPPPSGIPQASFRLPWDSRPFQILPNPSKSSQILPNSPKFSQILLNSPKFCQILQNSAKFCQILPNSAKFCQILPNFAKFCQILPNARALPPCSSLSARFLQIWQTWRQTLSSLLIW